MRIGAQLPASRSLAHSSSTTDPWQHHVEDQGVVAVLVGVPETLVAVEGDVHGETLILEPAA